MKRNLSLAVCPVCFCLMLLSGCDRNPVRETSFTRADSLTETYLALQDTLLQQWNTMVHDDNRKLTAMKNLIHELGVTNPEKRDEFEMLEERLENLKSLRYDQQTMSETDLVSEYDFASNSLVTELLALAESQKEFAYNTTLQKLVDSIRMADLRVNDYRTEYDRIASKFNRFIQHNTAVLNEFSEDSGLKKRPLFQMAAE